MRKFTSMECQWKLRYLNYTKYIVNTKTESCLLMTCGDRVLAAEIQVLATLGIFHSVRLAITTLWCKDFSDIWILQPFYTQITVSNLYRFQIIQLRRLGQLLVKTRSWFLQCFFKIPLIFFNSALIVLNSQLYITA